MMPWLHETVMKWLFSPLLFLYGTEKERHWPSQPPLAKPLPFLPLLNSGPAVRPAGAQTVRRALAVMAANRLEDLTSLRVKGRSAEEGSAVWWKVVVETRPGTPPPPPTGDPRCLGWLWIRWVDSDSFNRDLIDFKLFGILLNEIKVKMTDFL